MNEIILKINLCVSNNGVNVQHAIPGTGFENRISQKRRKRSPSPCTYCTVRYLAQYVPGTSTFNGVDRPTVRNVITAAQTDRRSSHYCTVLVQYQYYLYRYMYLVHTWYDYTYDVYLPVLRTSGKFLVGLRVDR
jgi:hypothetical protein